MLLQSPYAFDKDICNSSHIQIGWGHRQNHLRVVPYIWLLHGLSVRLPDLSCIPALLILTSTGRRVSITVLSIRAKWAMFVNLFDKSTNCIYVSG